MPGGFQIIDVRLFEPVPIGFRQARGVDLDANFTFVQDSYPLTTLDTYHPQLVMRPRSRVMANGYDMTVIDASNGAANVNVPGASLSDPNGYLAEVYFRDGAGKPTRMVAHGRLAFTGGGYAIEGPLGPATYPTGPAGPAGIKGDTGNQGPRGGTWTTGSGSPMTTGSEVEGDMYLNESNGDVWRYSSGLGWTQGTF